MAYKKFRSTFNLPQDAFIIGMVNRFHPMKDHVNFLEAASRGRQDFPNAKFVLVGRGIDGTNSVLMQQIQDLNLVDHVFLLGERTDIADITAAFDVASMTSAWGDAFPNVVGEAMACEVPCVVTDIGDAAQMVADTGIVVPPRNPDALFHAWEALIKMESNKRRELGRLARERIISNYSLPAIVHRYEAVYREVMSKLH
jgi:glycosyltransferase involved in cell wall biosynthesis